jgi:hypothetical protein
MTVISQESEMRPKLSQADKALTAAFRRWMGNPANPYALKNLVEHMVEKELQVRLKNLAGKTADDHTSPTAAP